MKGGENHANPSEGNRRRIVRLRTAMNNSKKLEPYILVTDISPWIVRGETTK